jgi:hypothetical protein
MIFTPRQTSSKGPENSNDLAVAIEEVVNLNCQPSVTSTQRWFVEVSGAANREGAG